MPSNHSNSRTLDRRSTQRDEVVSYSGVIKMRSLRAVLFIIVPTGQEYDAGKADQYDQQWFPLSHIKILNETRSVVNNTLDSIVVTKWIASQKGLV